MKSKISVIRSKTLINILIILVKWKIAIRVNLQNILKVKSYRINNFP